MSNEQLCAFAQKGDVDAKDQLIKNNLPFVHKLAYEVWSAQQELNIMIETARHFHLSENRAKATEKAALAHMRKELLGQLFT